MTTIQSCDKLTHGHFDKTSDDDDDQSDDLCAGKYVLDPCSPFHVGAVNECQKCCTHTEKLHLAM